MGRWVAASLEGEEMDKKEFSLSTTSFFFTTTMGKTRRRFMPAAAGDFVLPLLAHFDSSSLAPAPWAETAESLSRPGSV